MSLVPGDETPTRHGNQFTGGSFGSRPVVHAHTSKPRPSNPRGLALFCGAAGVAPEFGDTDIDYRNYVFEQEKNATEESPAEDSQTCPSLYARLVPKNYRLNYALDKLQTQVNNTFGTSFYQPYNGQANGQPGLGNASEIHSD